MEHTPTPWQWFDNGIDGTEVCDQNTAFIAGGMKEDDAEFIVRAVNSHDDLVEALKLAIDYLEEYGLVNVLCKDEEKIRKALAKSEGKN